jgi:hypothetical protein
MWQQASNVGNGLVEHLGGGVLVGYKLVQLVDCEIHNSGEELI